MADNLNTAGAGAVLMQFYVVDRCGQEVDG